jgi:MFS superfamily sulfate permease-like transporter
VVLIALALGPALTWLPMPVIGGVMALVGAGMIKLDELRAMRNRDDGPVFLVTMLAVVFLSLEAGILVAVAASVIFFVVNMSRINWTVQRAGSHERIVATGNLFYASMDPLADHLRSTTAVNTVLDLRGISYCDAAARHALEAIRRERWSHGRALEVQTA